MSFEFAEYLKKELHRIDSFKTKDEIQETEYINKLLLWLSTTPKYTTIRVNTINRSPHNVLDIIEENIGKQAEIHNSNLPELFIHPTLPDLVVVGCWKEINKSPKSALPEIIVDSACGAAVLRGSHVFAPAVMGLPNGLKIGEEVSVFADVSGKCKRGFLQKYEDQYKLFVGTGCLKMTRKELFVDNIKPKGTAVEMQQNSSLIPIFNIDSNIGLLQNLPSVVCVHVLNPSSEDVVLDMCAAPGHKTTHIAALMKNKGTVIAVDKTKNKVDRIKRLCEAFSVSCVKSFVYDSTKSVRGSSILPEEKCVECSKLMLEEMELDDSSMLEKKECDGCKWSPPFECRTFDKILLDAPCSGLGQRPQLSNKLTAKQLESYPALQRKLFHAAVNLLKENGILVYSTCTLTIVENEELVSWALEKYPNLELLPSDPILGQPGILCKGLNEEQCGMVQRYTICPNEKSCNSDTTGFFIAKFKKKL